MSKGLVGIGVGVGTGMTDPTTDTLPCEGGYCAIDCYYEWRSETHAESMMGSAYLGYSLEGGHPQQAAYEAVCHVAVPKPCTICPQQGNL